MTIPESYATVKGALALDPAFEAAMLRDVDAALASRYGSALPQPGRLTREKDGYALNVAHQTFTVGDPRRAMPGESGDAELEMVSGTRGTTRQQFPSVARRFQHAVSKAWHFISSARAALCPPAGRS